MIAIGLVVGILWAIFRSRAGSKSRRDPGRDSVTADSEPEMHSDDRINPIEKRIALKVTERESAIRSFRMQVQRKTEEESRIVVDELTAMSRFDPVVSGRLLADREHYTHELAGRIAGEESDRAKLEVATLMAHIDPAAGLPVLLGLSRSADPWVRAGAVGVLGDLKDYSADSGLEAAVLQALDDPDPAVRNAAIQTGGILGIESALNRFPAMLYPADGSEPHPRLFFWLGWHGRIEALEGARHWFLERDYQGERDWILTGLGCLADRGTKEMKRAILDLIRQAGWAKGSANQKMADVLSRHADATDGDWLRTLCSEAPDVTVRIRAVRTLARVEGAHAIPFLESLLESLEACDQYVRCSVVLALGEAALGTGDAELTERIHDLTRRAPEVRADAAVALLNIGAETGTALALELAETFPPHLKSSIRWKADGLSMAGLARRMADCGVTPRHPTPEEIKAAAALYEQDDLWMLMLMLKPQGVALTFDQEADEIPCGHDGLMERLAKSSLGQFNPEACYEDYHASADEEEPGAYTLSFLHANRVYQFKAEDHGDYYDADAVLLAVNRALADAGQPGRFLPFLTGDQVAAVLFAEPESMDRAGHLHLPLRPDWKDFLPEPG